jgi:hypothetical protein
MSLHEQNSKGSKKGLLAGLEMGARHSRLTLVRGYIWCYRRRSAGRILRRQGQPAYGGNNMVQRGRDTSGPSAFGRLAPLATVLLALSAFDGCADRARDASSAGTLTRADTNNIRYSCSLCWGDSAGRYYYSLTHYDASDIADGYETDPIGPYSDPTACTSAIANDDRCTAHASTACAFTCEFDGLSWRILYRDPNGRLNDYQRVGNYSGAQAVCRQDEAELCHRI